MNVPTTFELAVESIINFIAGILQGLIGRIPLWGQATLAELLAGAVLLAILFLIFLLIRTWISRFIKRGETRSAGESWPHQLVFALSKPGYALFWLFAAKSVLGPLLVMMQAPADEPGTRAAIDRLADVLVFAICIWLFYRLTDVLRVRLEVWSGKSKGKLDDLLIPVAVKSLRVILPLIALFLGLPILGLPPRYDVAISKIGSLTLICVVAWIIFQAIRLFENFILLKYDMKAADNLEARKIYTQVKVLSKTAYFITTLFAIASMLMVFEEARRFGTNILASAGVVGVIMGFAAQRTISNLFAGFQIAMTQPIRIDDVVIVEGEWGRIEEITLTYVVIAIWDQRRLIVPLSHFIEKPFQNWTRVSSEIMGSVFLYADYSVPLEELRKETKRLVESHPNWDKRFWNLQVTDATDRAIQLRVLATSADSGKSWDLRCDVRERLIEFIQKRHRESLPKLRAELDGQFNRPAAP